MDTFLNPDIEQAFQLFLDRVGPDVVHFQHVMSLSYRLVGQARRGGVPTVLTLHDYWFICSNSQLIWPDAQVCRGKGLGLNCARCVLTDRVGSRLLLTLLRPVAAPLLQLRDALVRRTVLEADLAVAPSHFLIRRYAQAGFPPQRLVYLENGIDTRRIQQHPHRPAEDGRVRFTYLGSLAWQKGVHVLVEAFRAIPADRGVLRICGSPDVFPAYAARLREIANPANTSFEGLVPNEKVGHILAGTDVLVVPSLWYENSPVVVQEALAARVPIIASDIGALPEKVGPAGWLFPVGSVQGLRERLRHLTTAGIPPDLRERIPEPTSITDAAGRLLKIYTEIRGTD
jgi:glycosyltransferase involved in cell wall biosynthesis